MTLLSRTKELTKKRGLTIEKLADRVGIAKSSIYQWNNHEPKPSTINKVADVLDVSTDYLLGRTNQMNSYDSQSKKTDILDDSVILAFDGMEIPEEDKEKLLDYARFVMEQRKEGKKGRLHL